jgi:O-antigen/teichoic acid export membrane protein
LNLVLIPRMSYDGAAISTVATIGTTLVLLWIVIARSMPIPGLLPVQSLSVVVVITAAVTVGGWFLVQHYPGLWLLVSVGAALLVATSLAAFVAIGVVESPMPGSAEKGRHRAHVQ